jgi:hypothetical protein
MNRINKVLEPGEEVVWIGMPVPRYFVKGIWGALVAGTIFTAFGILATFGYIKQNGFDIIPFIFGCSFILIGLLLLSTPIWSYRKALQTLYVISSKRAISIEEGGGSSISYYSPLDLQNIYCKVRSDGSGDVIILPPALHSSEKNEEQIFGFHQIRNPKEVEKKLKKLAEQADEPDGK